jgi:hypothetical protein
VSTGDVFVLDEFGLGRRTKQPIVKNAPEKLKGWINIYPYVCGAEYRFSYYLSRESADAGAGSDRIACIQVEFEQGEGL